MKVTINPGSLSAHEVADLIYAEASRVQEPAETFSSLVAVLDAISVMVVMQMYADAEHERRLDALNFRLVPGEETT